MSINRVIFNFKVKYEYEDISDYLEYPFVIKYKYNKYDGTVEEGSFYYGKTKSKGFQIRFNVAEEPDIYEESFEFTVSTHNELFEKDSFTIELDEEIVGIYVVNTVIDHTFKLNPIVDNIKKIKGVFGKTLDVADILLTEYERVFGNNDALLIWHDGKVMNLKYTESITSSYESNITDKRIDISRMGGDSYRSKELNEVELDITFGDVWVKNGSDDNYKKQNRNSALRTFHELYEKNIPVNFRSDVINIDTGIIKEYDVSQSSESDNTYTVSCVIKEISFIDRLPKVSLYRDDDGDYHELPRDERFEVRLYVTEEEVEEDDDSGILDAVVETFRKIPAGPMVP